VTSSMNFSLAYYSSDRKTGNIILLNRNNGAIESVEIDVLEKTDSDTNLKPIFVGISAGDTLEDRKIILLDPKTKNILFESAYPEDAFAAHLYEDPYSNRSWFMNDGDKATGNDVLNCGEQGSSVTVVENASSKDAKHLKTVCVGRGHHQAAFSFPSEQHPNTPKQAYISNLKDGTVSVIDNDPESERFLHLIATIDLCEPEKEDSAGKDGVPTVPNKAFPHGLVFSGVSGKLYNLNNGYGTVAIINPSTFEIEDRIAFKGHSNLFIPASGRYVIGRGADRKTDEAHVIAKLSVIDVETHQIKDMVDIPDVYISKYFFNPEGTRLYLTTSSSGNDKQKQNLKTDALLVFDITVLPEIKLINEVRLGSSTGTLDFTVDNGKSQLMFSSNAAEGAVIICNPETGEMIEKIEIAAPNAHSRLWCI